MEKIVKITLPEEVLLGTQLNVESLGELIKTQSALYLFKEGKISSGIAAKWLNISRVKFLLMAMDLGIELLDDSKDDFSRETSLL